MGRALELMFAGDNAGPLLKQQERKGVDMLHLGGQKGEDTHIGWNDNRRSGTTHDLEKY